MLSSSGAGIHISTVTSVCTLFRAIVFLTVSEERAEKEYHHAACTRVAQLPTLRSTGISPAPTARVASCD